MREIKFRGKRVDNGEWVYGNLIRKNKPTEVDDVFWCYLIHDCALTSNTVITETVGQYSGINDKYGKEIYEGDVFKFKSLHIPFLVEFQNGAFGYRTTPANDSYDTFISFDSNRVNYEHNLNTNQLNAIEIIDSIHDNPELLK